MKRFSTVALPLALALLFAGGALAASGPRVIANVNVDLDHGSRSRRTSRTSRRSPATR